MDDETNTIDKDSITVIFSTPSDVQVKPMHRYIDLRRIMSATSIEKQIACESSSQRALNFAMLVANMILLRSIYLCIGLTCTALGVEMFTVI